MKDQYRKVLFRNDDLLVILLIPGLTINAYHRSYGEWRLMEQWSCQVRDLDWNYWDWDERIG